MTLVERIKVECKEKNITISYIEKELGLGNGAISKWNKSSPSVDKIISVSQLLNISIEYLLTGKKQSNDLLSDAEKEWLSWYKELSLCEPSIQAECIGFVKGYIERGKI